MDSILDSGPLVQNAAFVAALAAGLLLEALRPLRLATGGNRWRRWAVNGGLGIVNSVLLVATLAVVAWLVQAYVGGGLDLLARSGASFWAAALLTLLSLEFFSYWLHRAYHAVPVLWRLHAVHHSDSAPDVTTTHRHHPGEALIGAVAALPTLFLLSPSYEVALAVSVFWAVVATFSHANLSVGVLGQRMVGWAIVTPDYHRVHHSADVRYADTQFATVIPLYDHLFGTTQRWAPEWQASAPMGIVCRP